MFREVRNDGTGVTHMRNAHLIGFLSAVLLAGVALADGPVARQSAGMPHSPDGDFGHSIFDPPPEALRAAAASNRMLQSAPPTLIAGRQTWKPSLMHGQISAPKEYPYGYFGATPYPKVYCHESYYGDIMQWNIFRRSSR
jgi:hypothetical protein